MVTNVRIDGDVAILSNFAGLLNNPRHFDARQDVRELLDQGYRKFIFELAGLRTLGTSAIGLLTTMTRLIRQNDGEAVLARLSPETVRFLEEMRMDDYWEEFDAVEAAKAFYTRRHS